MLPQQTMAMASPSEDTWSLSPSAPLVGFRHLGPADEPVSQATRRHGLRSTGHVRALSYLDLPAKAVEFVLNALYELYLTGDPVFEAKLRDHPDHDLARSSENVARARELWRTATFARQLSECAKISPIWDLSIRALDFWVKEFKDHLNCGRIDDIPDDNPVDIITRVPPLGMTRSCLVCLYLTTFQINSPQHDERTRYTQLITTDLGTITVCGDHNGWAICGKCLMRPLQRYDDTRLETNADYETFGAAAAVCRGCRYKALDVASSGRGYNPNLVGQIEFGSHQHRPVVYNYLERGLGTLSGCIDALDRENWIISDPVYLHCRQEYIANRQGEHMAQVEIKIRNAIENRRYDEAHGQRRYAEQYKKMPQFGNSAEDYQAILTMVLMEDIRNRIENGFWLTPQEDQEYRAAFQRCPQPDSRFFAVSYANGYRLISNWSQLQKSPIPPPLFAEMEDIYRRCLASKIDDQLHNVIKAIWRTANRFPEVAVAKACSMSAEELLEWLRDPRSNIRGGWWKDDNVPKVEWPPVLCDKEKELAAAQASSSVAGGKRKREGDDADAQVQIVGQGSRMLGQDRTRAVDAAPVTSSDSGVQISNSSDTSPHFQPKRRAASTSPHRSKEGRGSDESGGSGENRPNPQNASLINASNPLRSGPGMSTRSVDTPDTPSLVDDTDRSTPFSSELHSPEVQLPLATLTSLPRSYVADMVKRAPWPEPQERLTPEQLRVFQSGKYRWDARAPAVPISQFPRSPVTLDVIGQLWQSKYEEDQDCICGICERMRAEAVALDYQYFMLQARSREMDYIADLSRELMHESEDENDYPSEDDGFLTGEEPSDPPSEVEEDEVNGTYEPEQDPFA